MPNLFTKAVGYFIVELSAEGVEKLTRPITGTGGFQNFLRKLSGQIENWVSTKPSQVLVLDLEDVEKLLRYRASYGKGGYQDRLREPYDALLDLTNAVISGLKLKVQQDEIDG